MRSQFVLGGRFRVFDDGSISKVFDGAESPARVYYASKNKKYAVVSYMQGSKQKNAYVHRLVATAFVPNPNNYPEVNHLDGNTRNNAAQNLEWVTRKMNVRHAYESGLSNPMASAEPCKYCGNFTKSGDSICTKCRMKLMQESSEIDRRAEQRDKYAKIDTSLLSPSEMKYVKYASDGMFVSEIAEMFGVTKQCVSAALLFAEKKSASGRHITKGQENKRITFVCRANRAKRKMDAAESEYKIAKSNFESAEKALLLFEQSISSAISNPLAQDHVTT